MDARSWLPTHAQAVVLHWGAHLEVANAGLPGKDCYVGVAYLQPATTPKTMLNHRGVILLTTVLLPFSSVDKSRMAENYWQTLLVLGEV